MQRTFDSREFVRRIGHDLVREIDNARQATTSELVGDAIEQPVRDRLEQILPRGIAVGSGCVIDTNGRTSRQQDVVLYERDICPVFCINNSPETTYYPCEGVIAVGEVKSVIGSREIVDAFEKVASVKSLQRDFNKRELPELNGRIPYERIARNYGQIATPSIIEMVYDANSYEPNEDVFGFVLADRMSLKEATMFDKYCALVEQFGYKSPDIAVFLDGSIFNAYDRSKEQTTSTLSVKSGDIIGWRKHESPFANLVSWLFTAYNLVKTPGPAVFRKYFEEERGQVPILGLREITAESK